MTRVNEDAVKRDARLVHDRVPTVSLSDAETVLRALYAIRGEQMVAGRQRKRAEPRPPVPTMSRPTMTLDEERAVALLSNDKSVEDVARIFGFTRGFVESVATRLADFIELVRREGWVPPQDKEMSG